MWYIDALQPLFDKTDNPEISRAFSIFLFAFLEKHIVEGPLELESRLGIIEKSYFITDKLEHPIPHKRLCNVLLAAGMVYGKLSVDEYSIRMRHFAEMAAYPLFINIFFTPDWVPTFENVKAMIYGLMQIEIKFLQQIEFKTTPHLERMRPLLSPSRIYTGFLNAIPNTTDHSDQFELFVDSLLRESLKHAAGFASKLTSGYSSTSPLTDVWPSPRVEESPFGTPIDEIFTPAKLSLTEEAPSSRFRHSAPILMGRERVLSVEAPVYEPVPLLHQAVSVSDVDLTLTPVEDPVIETSAAVAIAVDITSMSPKDYIARYPLRDKLYAFLDRAPRATSFCLFSRPNPVINLVGKLIEVEASLTTMKERAFLLLAIMFSPYPELITHMDSEDKALTKRALDLFEERTHKAVQARARGLCNVLFTTKLTMSEAFIVEYDECHKETLPPAHNPRLRPSTHG